MFKKTKNTKQFLKILIGLVILFCGTLIHQLSYGQTSTVGTDTPVQTTSTDVSSDAVADATSENKTNDYPVVNLHTYNVFSDLPKIGQPLALLYNPFSQFTYGPYEPAALVYDSPYPSVEELTERIIALKKTIEQIESEVTKDANKSQLKPDSNDPAQNQISKKNKNKITEMKIHLADLYAIKYYKTRVDKYIEESVELYKNTYPDLPLSFAEITSLNMINALIAAKDFATSFPILKKLSKKNSSKNIRDINNTLLEFYYMSERYKKADDTINVKIEKKELMEESHSFLVRTGDVFFLLDRFQDASEWYQSVLKPEESASEAENLSWLYLAEALHQTGSMDVSQKLYSTMSSFFDDTVYASIIRFRLARSIEEKELIIKETPQAETAGWMRVELLTEKFINNPSLFTAENFNDIIDSFGVDDELRDQILLLQAYGYRNENKLYNAIDNFHILEIKAKNRYVREALNKLIVDTLFKKGLATTDSEDALKFVRTLLTLKYNLRTDNPDDIYKLLYHNLNMIGLENASAELTLRIIDLSVHTKKDKNYLQLKMARDMHAAFAYRQSIKVLEQIDIHLLDPMAREDYNAMLIDNLIETEQISTALDMLTNWGHEGTSPKQAYWIALNKTKIFYKLKKYKEALDVITNTIGDGVDTKLPQEFEAFILPMKAYQVILYNKLEQNNECLFAFNAYKDKILTTDETSDVLLSAISSAMTMNRDENVSEILALAKQHLDEETYKWLHKWTQGKMWINQINRYLDDSNLAVNKEGELE